MSPLRCDGPPRTFRWVGLGAHLGRLEIRIFFEELLGGVTDSQLAGEPLRSATVFVGDLKHLLISYQVQ
jgi:alpha-terpineol hydroxylase